MNDHPTRPAASSSRRRAGLAPFALAAGLVVGHVVEAMAHTGDGTAMTAVAAVVFLAAAMAGTVCGLAGMAAPGDAKRARALTPGLVVATGIGIVVALLPGLL